MGKVNRDRHRKQRRIVHGPTVFVDGRQLDKLFDGSRIPLFTGKHLWIMAGMWTGDPLEMLGGQWHMDLESLINVSGPGCYWCEQSYTPELLAEPCVQVPDP